MKRYFHKKNNKLILIIISLVIIVSLFLSILRLVMPFQQRSTTKQNKQDRIIVVDKNLNIKRIINYSQQEVEPVVYLENEKGVELPYTDSIKLQFISLQSAIDLTHFGVIYDRDGDPKTSLIKAIIKLLLK